MALDGRPVRTPGRAPLILPTEALAAAVAAEWNGVGETVDPRAMPLTGLANAAIDRVAPDPRSFAAGLARYAESDLLCYRAAEPEPLVERQRAAWDPVIAWARARYDIALEVTAGVMHRPQPAATLARLGEAIAARDPFTLAALSPVVTLTGSLLLATGADRGRGGRRHGVARGACRRGLAGGAVGGRSDGGGHAGGAAADFHAAVRFLALRR